MKNYSKSRTNTWGRFLSALFSIFKVSQGIHVQKLNFLTFFCMNIIYCSQVCAEYTTSGIDRFVEQKIKSLYIIMYFFSFVISQKTDSTIWIILLLWKDHSSKRSAISEPYFFFFELVTVAAILALLRKQMPCLITSQGTTHHFKFNVINTSIGRVNFPLFECMHWKISDMSHHLVSTPLNQNGCISIGKKKASAICSGKKSKYWHKSI